MSSPPDTDAPEPDPGDRTEQHLNVTGDGNTTVAALGDIFYTNVTGIVLRWSRRVGLAAVAFVGVILLTIVLIAVQGDNEARRIPGCDDIGVLSNPDDHYWDHRESWWAAYQKAGGREVIGCPVLAPGQGFVHSWGEGMVQDLVDRNGNETRLMALTPGHVIAMTQEYWGDYTRPHRVDAARIQGFPIADPTQCGNAKIVPLDRGAPSVGLTPGAMVSTPRGNYVWLPRPVWDLYQQYGGAPAWGRPLNGLDQTIAGRIEFEFGGSIEIALRNAIANVDRTPRVDSSNDLCPTA